MWQIYFFAIKMVAIASLLLLSAGRETRAETTDAGFRAGSEFFVLDKTKKENGEWMFFVTPAENPTSGFWIPVNPRERRFDFFGSDEDLLAYDVANPLNAKYLKAKGPVTKARKDDQNFAKLTTDPHWRDQFFRRLEDNIPKTGLNVQDKTTDNGAVCPAHPQAKDGSPCEEVAAQTLPPRLVQMIQESSQRNKVPPALLAALIQTESEFDFWRENTKAKKDCEKDSSLCSKYKWERGLGQLGKKVSEDAGILWEKSVGHPPACKKDALTNSCIDALEEACKEFHGKKPYDCPAAAVEAAARKLKSTREKQANTNVYPEELAAHLQPADGGLEAWRNVVGAYNRGPRVANAYAEYNRQHKRYPSSYGEAWSAERRDESPSSKAIGYSLLHKEYINRCYVYRIIGICGALPKQSLVRQFEKLGTDLLEGGKRGRAQRALARE